MSLALARHAIQAQYTEIDNEDINILLQSLFRMKTSSPVMGAFEYRDSVILLGEMTLVKNPTPLMEDFTDQYLRPFSRSVNHWFSVCGFCPYRVMRRQFRATKDDVRAPVVYEPADIYIIRTLDEKNGTRGYDVYDKLTSKPVQYLLRSTAHEGPSLTTTQFKTECGAIIEEFVYYQELKHIQLEIIRREANPSVTVVHSQPAASQPNAIADELLDEFVMSLKDDTGNSTGKSKVVRMERHDGVNALPSGWTTATQQVRATNHVDENAAWSRLIQVITMTLKVPAHVFDSGPKGAGFHSKSQHVVDDERMMILSSCRIIADAVAFAMKQVLEVLYKQEHVPVIPLRAQLDRDTIEKMHTFGALDDKQAMTYMYKLAGIPLEDMHDTLHNNRREGQNGKQAPASKNKRQKPSDDDAAPNAKHSPKKKKDNKKDSRASKGEDKAGDNTNDIPNDKSAEDKTKSKKKKKKAASKESDDESGSSSDSESEKEKSRRAKSKKQETDGNESDSSSSSEKERKKRKKHKRRQSKSND